MENSSLKECIITSRIALFALLFFSLEFGHLPEQQCYAWLAGDFWFSFKFFLYRGQMIAPSTLACMQRLYRCIDVVPLESF